MDWVKLNTILIMRDLKEVWSKAYTLFSLLKYERTCAVVQWSTSQPSNFKDLSMRNTRCITIGWEQKKGLQILNLYVSFCHDLYIFIEDLDNEQNCSTWTIQFEELRALKEDELTRTHARISRMQICILFVSYKSYLKHCNKTSLFFSNIAYQSYAFLFKIGTTCMV